MNRAIRTLAPLVLLGLAALAACGGGGGSNTPANTNCVPPQGQVSLVYPAPGSTGIPDDVFGVVFASTNGLPSSFQALVEPIGQSAVFTLQTVTAAPSPIPSPLATPTFANPIYQESAFVAQPSPFPNNTVLQVYLNNAGAVCTPMLLGTFNSQ